MTYNAGFLTDLCRVRIDCSDKRSSEKNQDAMIIAFYRHSAAKLNDVVCARFGIVDEKDKKLFESIYYDRDYEHFTFQDNNPNIAYKISIRGNSNAIEREESPDFGQPAFTDSRTAIQIKKYETIGALKIKQEKTYSFDQIENILYRDYPVVTLFNSNSFKRLNAYRTDLSRGRVLEKLTYSKL